MNDCWARVVSSSKQQYRYNNSSVLLLIIRMKVRNQFLQQNVLHHWYRLKCLHSATANKVTAGSTHSNAQHNTDNQRPPTILAFV